MQETYGVIVANASVIMVNPDGEFMREVAVFNEKLRAIQLGLSACLYYGESLKSDIAADISALENNLATAYAIETDTIKSTVATLNIELAATEKALAECNRYSDFIREVVYTLRIIKEERQVAQLVKLEKDLAENAEKGGKNVSG